ncbi:hypothetical protein CMI47_06460 [Candidatus Pacearchaeota archaeon]|nr:hypothetical protein [Candidatus Pacearchaeota archaeon]|tara:strand:- start:163 stop:1029 length:867 start_codon:yes stop_codon:yes gene_type:complete
MISIVGLGNAASAIAANFKSVTNYNVFVLNDKVGRSSKYKFKLKSYFKPEEYEENIPDLKKFFSNLDPHVEFVIVGSSYSSNYSLGILQQLRDKRVDVIYVKPDIELLTGVPKLLENMVFGVLQEYARSGLINSLTLICNLKLEEIIQNVPVKEYYNVLNNSIYSTVHYLNFFEHNEPEIGLVAKPSELCRIRTVGILDMQTLQEKWLFDLDVERELCYYMCINKKRLEEEGGLHRKIVGLLKEKPRNAFRKISYAIYETPLEQDFGFVVAHTNTIQTNKTLDKLTSE